MPAGIAEGVPRQQPHARPYKGTSILIDSFYPDWGILGNLCQAVVSREHGWSSGRSMRYREEMPAGRSGEQRPARFPINGWAYCAAFLASCVLCWRSFSSSAVLFGGTSLMVSLSSLPVKRNGGW
jgi:hypothetical protein